MIVYRNCSKEELIKLVKREEIGHKFETNPKVSSHVYDDNKNYVHFFYEIDSCLYKDTSSGNFICTYTFPNEYDKYRGVGYYLDPVHFVHLQTVNEIAIPSELVSIDNLINTKLIVDPIDFEDYVYEGMGTFTKEYSKEEVKTLVKKKH